ncbi:hypothetical protein NG831_06545 [Xanthomonas sacchari]|uniref:hypothetical protein n=1 Tax=Xanthomonas sacchari TaxID=56458 RepID=UPI002256356A|nr:hypothetical protein [Xanthomonas sacchari]MCW0413480.1 hypothetical protein [Xanthomonas sacchari]UYK67819.1 hypothetical protein NG831_06545 [Xanthomonas sacchari]
MRQQALSAVKAGITRLRDKGGASPDSLYDLLNGYVTAARTIKARGGTRIDYQLPSGLTKGLVYFRGQFVVFASDPLAVGASGYTVEILKHPDSQSAASLVDIHFAMPFLGYLYVVAEWSDGSIYHYWLQSAETWKPNTMYFEGDTVAPVVLNGYAYVAERQTAAPPVWAAGVARAVGDKVLPTTGNGYQYTVIQTVGSKPSSGAAEPKWPTTPGGTVTESSNGSPSGTAVSSGISTLPKPVTDRYGTGNAGSNTNSSSSGA